MNCHWKIFTRRAITSKNIGLTSVTPLHRRISETVLNYYVKSKCWFDCSKSCMSQRSKKPILNGASWVSSVWKLLEKVGDLETLQFWSNLSWHFWHLLICTKPGQIVSDYHPPFSNGFKVFNYLESFFDAKLRPPLSHRAPKFWPFIYYLKC